MIFSNFYSKYIDLNYSKYKKRMNIGIFVKFEIDIFSREK